MKFTIFGLVLLNLSCPKKHVIYEDNYDLRYINKKLYQLINDGEPAYLIVPAHAADVDIPFGHITTSAIIVPRTSIQTFKRILLSGYDNHGYTKCRFRESYTNIIFFLFSKN